MDGGLTKGGEPLVPPVEIQSTSISFTITTCGYIADETSTPAGELRLEAGDIHLTVLFETSIE